MKEDAYRKAQKHFDLWDAVNLLKEKLEERKSQLHKMDLGHVTEDDLAAWRKALISLSDFIKAE